MLVLLQVLAKGDCFCCTCGRYIMPSSEQKRTIQCQPTALNKVASLQNFVSKDSHASSSSEDSFQRCLEILSIPYYILKTDFSRGAKHGSTQWQYDHWKAKDTKRNALKKECKSITRQVAKRRPFPKFSNCRRMGRGLLSIFGFDLNNQYLIHHCKK